MLPQPWSRQKHSNIMEWGVCATGVVGWARGMHAARNHPSLWARGLSYVMWLVVGWSIHGTIRFTRRGHRRDARLRFTTSRAGSSAATSSRNHGSSNAGCGGGASVQDALVASMLTSSRACGPITGGKRTHHRGLPVGGGCASPAHVHTLHHTRCTAAPLSNRPARFVALPLHHGRVSSSTAAANP